MSAELNLCGEQIRLLPERAFWWPAQRTLVISDLHWGKSGHFRKHGIPMPGGTQWDDASRLAKLIQTYPVEQLIIAGDMFHSRMNAEVETFGHWRDAHSSLHIQLVMGNHDILSTDYYRSLKLEIIPEYLKLGPFEIRHDGPALETDFAVRGHLHPGIRLPGPGAALPCFAIDSNSLTLPAFGRFTGCKRIDPLEYQQIYVIGEEKVLKLK